MNTNVNKMRCFVKKSAPDLFLAGGVISILIAGGLAIKQTPKAMKILEKKKEEKNIEKVKAVAPLYIPSAVLTCIGVASIVCSRNMTNRKLAAMTTAYTMSETAYKTYRNKVKEMVDDDKYKDIEKEVVKETTSRNPVGSREVFIQPKGEVLMYDNSSGRYFKSSMNEVERAVNLLNKKMRSDMTIVLNEFYIEIGLPPIKLGEELGWDIDKGDIDFVTSTGLTEDQQPCIVIELLGFTAM